MSRQIPAPPPPERPRRSSIGQAAQADATPVVSSLPAGGIATHSTTGASSAVMKPIALTIPEDLKTRMVNTLAWTTPHTGISKQQQFIRKAIEEMCERLESAHNNGQMFEPIPKNV